MSDSETKYLALEAIADCVMRQSGKAEIDPGNITITLAPHFWHKSFMDVMRASPTNIERHSTVEHQRSFEIHGIKFVRGDK